MSEMNKYHDGRLLEWVAKMIGAGWQFYLFADPKYLWRHADEPVTLSIPESRQLFKIFVDAGEILDPYQVQVWQDGTGTL